MNNIKELLNFIICLMMFDITNSVLFLPNLFDKVPTAFKIVCHSKVSLTNSAPANLFCKNEAKIKIFESVSGKQDKEVCFHLNDEPLDAEPCTEKTQTTQLLQEKCNGRELCNIDLSESFPCSQHIFSFLNISYSCVPKHVPYKAFAIARFGNGKLRKQNREQARFQKRPAVNKPRTSPKNKPPQKARKPPQPQTRRQSLKSLFKPPSSLRLTRL